MKNLIKNYYWIMMVLVFMLMLVAMYKIVDDPEEVGARQDQYSVPAEIADAAERYGAEYNICPELIEAMAWYESNYYQYDTSSTGCCGIMQVNPRWHWDRMERLGVTDIYDIDGNIHCGVDYLAELLEENEELAVALAIYNGQSKRDVDAAMYDGYISKYASAILNMSYELETMHGKHLYTYFPEPDLEWDEAKG